MKKKIILAMAVFAFAVFSIVLSYSAYGKKVSENTSGTPDGKILVCRRYSEISKVMAIDSKKKSHKKEIGGYNYDASTGELNVTEDLSDFNAPIFHIEGKASEPAQFILWNMDSSSGPVAVFLNGKCAAENRDYTINAESKKLTLAMPAKELSSVVIVWHTEEGLSSISEMTEQESDLYAELEGAWFTEIAKKKIMEQTEEPALYFGNKGEQSDKPYSPAVVMKKLTEEEKRKMADELPVNAYKFRRNKSMASLSKEAGFKIDLPKKNGDYKLVSTMLIESSLKGEKTKSVEFSYDKSDFFSLSSISITTSNAVEGKAEEIEYPMSEETLNFKIPVKKQVCWAISNEGENSYKPEIICIYSWKKNKTLYRIQCAEKNSREAEKFIAGL